MKRNITFSIALLLAASAQMPLHALTTTIANVTDQEIAVKLYQENGFGYVRAVQHATIKPNEQRSIALECKNLMAVEVAGKQYAPLKTDQDSLFVMEPDFKMRRIYEYNPNGAMCRETTEFAVITFLFSDPKGIAYLEHVKTAKQQLDRQSTFGSEQHPYAQICNTAMNKIKESRITAPSISYRSAWENMQVCYDFSKRDGNTEVYDLTAKPEKHDDCYIGSYNRDKSFRVRNNTPYTAYIRIGYETACAGTGFYLAPGQAVTLYKPSGCIATNLFGYLFTGYAQSIPTNKINHRYHELGEYMWQIDYDAQSNGASITRVTKIRKTSGCGGWPDGGGNPDCLSN
jgi:hypothetical protein